MCGIVGIVGAREPIGPELITAMRDCLSHRGPDDRGIAFSRDGTTAFGHRRLAIIDPSPAGHQPMTNARHTLLLSYNGEIFNFRNLRTALEGYGVRFVSRSDAEVLLKACEHWGPAALEHLRGMFAFALWNEETRDCLLARDRLGIKPLYYALVDGALYFASEATALLAAPTFSREIDPTALNDYLAYGYVPAPRSIWRRLRKLEPGHYLRYHDGQIEIRRYWSAADATTGTLPANGASEAVFERVDEAVRLCMVSDVPVGTFLSGGIDSSTVTALMARAADRPIRTYSIDFDGTPRSEVRFARMVARHYGTVHNERALRRPPTLEALRRVIAAYDEPLADESILPTFAVSEEVARSIKVVLSGDGGDEVFAGYRWYQKAVHLATWRRRLGVLAPALAALGRQWRAAAGNEIWAQRLALLEGPSLDNYFRLRGFLNVDDRRRLLPAELKAAADDDLLWKWRPHWHREIPLVRRLQLLDIASFLPDDILTKVDRASMHHALEVRVPLLDHRLVEMALALPREAVFRHGAGKVALKEVARRVLPEPVVSRAKQGFGVPRREWEQRGLETTIRRRLMDGELSRRGWIDHDLVEDWMEHPRGRTPNKIWLLLALDVWLEAHDVC